MERANEFRILGWLEDEEFERVSSDIEPELPPEVLSDTDAEPEHQEENTDSEQSDDAIEQRHQHTPARAHQGEGSGAGGGSGGPTLTGKDGITNWYVHNPSSLRSTRTPRENVVTRLPGVKNVARGKNTIIDCWGFYFPDDVIDNIVLYTNQKLLLMSHAYTRGIRDIPQTDAIEMKAFIGTLYMAGVKKANHLNIDELWSNDSTCPEFFSAVMSKKRFQTLVQALRFDDRNTRAARKRIDNLAPIRELFERFVTKCDEAYSISEYATIDEMLEAFRGHCKFRVYIPNKPAKYGLKVYALVDARTFYTSKMEVYPAQQPQGPFFLSNDASSVVKRLIQPIVNTGRNVTTDNYFTSVLLANELFANHRLTIVGTIRKNKPQIPPELCDIRNRPVKSSFFVFGKPPNKCLLTSYVPKRGKNVLLLSTMHKDDRIDEDSGDLLKPEVITFYNLTKEGVDVVDRLKSEYDVSRISNRWPLRLFFTMLNVGAINSQIVFRANTQQTISRRSYLMQLAKTLTQPHLEIRAAIPHLHVELKQKIQRVAKLPPPPPQPRRVDGKPRCVYCPLRKNRFTQQTCSNCSSPICKEHTAKTVLTCSQCHDLEERQ
uniref:PiggyBac transposable element-derived protein domain-containing protein n=1 Tax=Graphocephala atropunctata TaxID=36148 RepID=A0A1B6M803_9HEMI